MIKKYIILFMIFAMLSCALATLVYADMAGIKIKVLTDKDVYAQDEIINVFIQALNPGEKAIDLKLSTKNHPDYSIDSFYEWSSDMTVLTFIPVTRLPPKSAVIVCQFAYEPDEQGNLPLGEHVISGEIKEYGSDTIIIRISSDRDVLSEAAANLVALTKQETPVYAPEDHSILKTSSRENVSEQQASKKGREPTKEQEPSGRRVQARSEDESSAIERRSEKIVSSTGWEEDDAEEGFYTMPPSMPVIDRIIPLTNMPTQELTGTKDSDSSILLNGTEIIPIDSQAVWSYTVALVEGLNTLRFTSENEAGMSPENVFDIELDTIAPMMPVVDSVISPTAEPAQAISGTKDANCSVILNDVQIIPADVQVIWSYTIELSEGNNTLTLTSKDAAGNESAPYTTNIILDADPHPPTVNLTANGEEGLITGSLPFDVTFTAVANDKDGTIASYEWEFGNGDTATTTEPEISYKYTFGGIYRASVTVTDDSGLTATDSDILIESTNNLVVYMKFDDDPADGVLDSSPYANHGINYNAVLNSGNGINGVYEFSGAEYIDIPDSSSIGITGQITLCVWMKTNVVAIQKLFHKSGCYYLYCNKSYGWVARLYKSGGSHTVSAGVGQTETVLGQWYHIAMTYDGYEMVIYIDGVRKNSVGFSNPMIDFPRPLYIGRESGGSNYLNGAMDEARIYNRALTAEEIQLIHSSK